MTAVRPEPAGGRPGSVHRTFDILEVVAALGGASAKQIADATGLPLPTVYRLVRELLDGDYLVHIREEKRFELGYKLHSLGVSLHQQLGVPREVRAEVTGLHQELGLAAYFAVHRGSQIVVVHTADSRQAPRLQPLDFGFHEAAHATAFGKILLAGMEPAQRALHLDPDPMPRLGPGTITSRAELDPHLDRVADRGIAWEVEEFQAGATCAAAAVRSGSGALLGSVAVSAPCARLQGPADEGERAPGVLSQADVEAALRATASRVSRYYRSGTTRPRG
jgi:DNA-binding IclR family transcriptional regulator